MDTIDRAIEQEGGTGVERHHEEWTTASIPIRGEPEKRKDKAVGNRHLDNHLHGN